MRQWDETWMAVAQVVALRSLCSRAQVGAVIVTAENRIVATGYNGPPRMFDHGERPCVEWCERAANARKDLPIAANYSDCPSSHAESNAFMAADRSLWQRGTLYVTGDICQLCTKLVANSGLARVVVQPDRPQPHRESDASYEFIRRMGIRIEIMPPPRPPHPDELPTIVMGPTCSIIQVQTVAQGWVNIERE